MTHSPIAQHLAEAVSHYQAGRAQDSVQLCRQILSIKPSHIDALNLLGASLFSLERLDDAIEIYRKIVALAPQSAEAHNNLAGCLQRSGRIDEAIAEFKTAIALDPKMTAAHQNLGMALRQLHREDEALAAFQMAIAGEPNPVVALYESGKIFLERSQYDRALEFFQKVLALKPDFIQAIGNLSTCLLFLEKFDEALAAVRQVIQLNPNSPSAYNNLGMILHGLDKDEEALAAFQKAVQLQPGMTTALSNLAKSLAIADRPEETIIVRRRAVELEPGLDVRHQDYGISLLSAGQFDPGWREFEYRAEVRPLDRQLQRLGPRWDGSNPAGKTILIAHEQGLGDVIHFVRYATLIQQRGGNVVLECQPELQRILENFRSIDHLVLHGQRRPLFDFYCPIMSLGLVFGTNLQTIPAEVPYLRPPAELCEAWGRKLGPARGRLRVGIVWAGSPNHGNDRRRSIRLDQLAPLASVPNIEFFSLQKGKPAEQVNQPPNGMSLANLSPDITDFADTAAIISHLDLVICVDTSVAHLAGALAKPVWVMLPRETDWRWMLHREDSPWYPTMRLFRQKPPGNWSELIQRVARALADFKSL
jgi:tetratricopeptide (TPR) repeat protein